MTRINGIARRFFAGILFLTTVLTASCGNEEGFLPQQPPTGFLRIVNAIPDSPTLQFVVDDRPEANLEFGQASPFISTLPDLPIPVSARYQDENQPVTVIATQITIQQDRGFTLVVTGSLDSPQLMMIDNPPLVFEEGITTADIQFAHAASNGPDSVDLLIDEPATTTTIAFGEATDLQSVPADTDLTFRARETGTATDLWSGTSAFTVSARRLLLLVDYFGPGGGSVRLLRIGESGALPFSLDYPSAIRVANMTPDKGPLDITANETPLAQNIGFGETGSYVNIPAGEVAIRVTLSGQPESIVSEAAYVTPSGAFQTLTLAGLNDTNNSNMSNDDRRRVPVRLTFNITHAAPSANPDATRQQLDVYVLEQGDTVANSSPVAILPYLGTTSLIAPQGTYDVVVTNNNSEEIVFGPRRIDIVDGGLYRIFITDSVGGGLPLDIVLEDDFLPFTVTR